MPKALCRRCPLPWRRLSSAGVTSTIPTRDFASPLSISRSNGVPRATSFSLNHDMWYHRRSQALFGGAARRVREEHFRVRRTVRRRSKSKTLWSPCAKRRLSVSVSRRVVQRRRALPRWGRSADFWNRRKWRLLVLGVVAAVLLSGIGVVFLNAGIRFVTWVRGAAACCAKQQKRYASQCEERAGESIHPQTSVLGGQTCLLPGPAHYSQLHFS